MRRIVEGLGLGLARRAARKLVPVVLTLGSGPSGFPRNLSGRRPKLPRQPRRGRVARARSRNFDAGSWPVGLLETTFRATAEASATAMANPRRRTRALRYFGAGGWPVGLPETIFRATAKASATASLALASVVLALGVGPTGFPKQVSERCKAGESWTPTAMANPRRRTRALRYFGAGGWPVGLLETIFRATAEASATAMANPRRRIILALGAGPSGFPKQFSGRRPKLLRQPPSRSRWGLARRASRNKFPSDAKRGDLGRRQPWQTRAVARARSVISALGAGPSGFRKQSSGRSFRDSHGKPAPSLAHAPLFWRWGLARRASRNKFPSDAKRMRPEAYVATRAAQIFKGEGQASGRNGRFINQKRTNGQISSFGLRMADFILSRIRSLSAARIKFYQQYQGRGPGSGRNGRFIKQKRPNCQIS